MRSLGGALVPAIAWIIGSFVAGHAGRLGQRDHHQHRRLEVVPLRRRVQRGHRGRRQRSRSGSRHAPDEAERRRVRTRDAFRRATGQFATGIVVIAANVDGVTHAMTVNAFTSVSLKPLLVLACVEKAARFHDAVLAAGTWAISVLTEDAEKTARWLATRGRPLEGQLYEHPHHPGAATGAPIPR